MGGLYCGFFRGDTAPWMRVSKQPILRCAFFVMFYHNENFIISVSCLEKIGSKSLEQTGKNTVYLSSLNIRLSADSSFETSMGSELAQTYIVCVELEGLFCLQG